MKLLQQKIANFKAKRQQTKMLIKELKVFIKNNQNCREQIEMARYLLKLERCILKTTSVMWFLAFLNVVETLVVNKLEELK